MSEDTNTTDERFWKCPNGHVLGSIQRNGNRTPQLALYRHAIDLEVDELDEVEVIGLVLGRMPVRCDACDEVALWDISADALAELYEIAEGRRMKEFLGKVGKRKVES